MHQFHPISPIIFVDGFPLSPRSNLGHLEGSAAAIAMNKCILVVMHAMAVWNSVFTVDDSEGFLDCRRRFHGLESQLEPQTYPAACLNSPRYDMKI